MNSDSESPPNRLLAWLLAANAATSEYACQVYEDINGVENPLETAAALTSGDEESGSRPQTFQLGEIPTVQERFQAVLKRRLQIQIQNHPPLFPWETKIIEYPDYVDNPSNGLVPALGWAAAQQSRLNLPIPLPEKVFQQLLEKCQALLTSSLPLGPKLVQVVESFFPDDSQTLNDLAGMVLRTPLRSVEALEMPNLESSYSDLLPRQQMVFSLLAAKELLENLTLLVSSTNPVVERQWLTSAGVLTLKVEYHLQGNLTKLRVDGKLPSKGVLKIRADRSQAMAQSSSPGFLSVELYSQQSSPTYTLEVESPELEAKPLSFVICPTN